MLSLDRRQLFRTLAVGFLAPVAPIATGKPKNKTVYITPLPTPVEVRRPVDDILTDFGNMVFVYRGLDNPILIEIDLISNQSGNDKLPDDVGQFIRTAIDRIRYFLTDRTLPEGVESGRPAAGLAVYQQSMRAAHPQPQFRIVGALQRSTESSVKGRNVSSDALFGGGHTETDLRAAGDRTRTNTALTLSLTVESPDRISVPGGSAQYRVTFEKDERNRSFSAYIGTIGAGFGSKLTTTQEISDALYDMIGLTCVHILGEALYVPFWRASPWLPRDPMLEDRVRDLFLRSSVPQLEQRIKAFMIADGVDLDATRPELTDVDRAVLLLELHRRSLGPANHASLVNLAMQEWCMLDYRGGVPRLAAALAKRARDGNDAAANEHAAFYVNPTEFGWPAAARIVILDLSRVVDTAQQNQVAAVARSLGQMQVHPNKPLIGVLTTASAADIQYALSRSPAHLEYVWLRPYNRLLLAPIKHASPQSVPGQQMP
jgi:hypothetical protein